MSPARFVTDHNLWYSPILYRLLTNAPKNRIASFALILLKLYLIYSLKFTVGVYIFNISESL